MISCPPTDAPTNPLLESVIADYLQAEESGQPQSHQDWLARHPELADDLKAFFDSRQYVPRLWPNHPLCETPSQFGDYELLEPIARGGMGIVYKARHTRLNRVVALKLIVSGQLARRCDVERFHAEAEAAASLDHPHIVPIYEVGQHAGQYFFTMKLINGGSLADTLTRRASEGPEGEVKNRRSEVSEGQASSRNLKSKIQNLKSAAELLSTVARAIHYAHQRGILHRDLKPSNILLDDDGQPYVTDFGLAKRVEGDDSLSGSGAIVGTPLYMAPEQAAGQKRLTTATDIYSLGAILYWLLTGKPAFQATTPLETLRQVQEQEPVRPSTLNPALDRDLETICLKCLEKDPLRRYASAAALADDLDHWLTNEPILARPASTVERSWRWCRRNPAPAAASGLAVVAFAAVVALAVGSVFAFRLGEEQQRTHAALQQAEVQQAVAQQQGAEADRQRQRAQEQEKLARQYLYGANILLAQRAWDSNHVDLMLDYLERHIPQPGEGDIRGFEWHYLWRQAHRDLLTIKVGARCDGVAFTADGRSLLTGETNGHVRVRDAKTGEEIRSWKEQPSPAFGHAEAFTREGDRVALGTETGSIRIVDVSSGQEVTTLQNDKPIRLLAFSPDGKRLASAVRDKPNSMEMQTRTVWDLATGREIVTIKHDLMPGYQWSLVFSPDSKRLASGSRNKIKIWDATTGEELRSIEGKFGSIGTGLAFSPDGKRLAAGSQQATAGGFALVWDAETGEQLFALQGHTAPVWGVAFSPDGKRLATGSKDSTVKVWDLTTGKEIGTFKGHRSDVWSVAYSADGTRLVSGSDDRTVKIWDATALDEGRTIKAHESSIDGLRFSPDGKLLASAGDNGVWDEMKDEFVPKPGEVYVLDVSTGRRILSLNDPFGFGGVLAFSPDGKQLTTSSRDGTIRLWDRATGQEIRSFKAHKEGVRSLAFSPDGLKLLIGTGPGFKLFAAASGAELHFFKHKSYFVTLSPDGTRIAASENAKVNLIDARDGKVLFALMGHAGFCTGVAFSPDGKFLASGSWDSTAKLWDCSTGREIRTFKGHTGSVGHVIFSPDGKRLATISPERQDRTIKIWDTSTGQELLTLKGHTGEPVFSPDGNLLASPGPAGTIQIYDATPLPEKP